MTHDPVRPFIDGCTVPGEGAPFTTENPARAETLAVVEAVSAAQVDTAVAVAQRAFADWSRRPPAERGRVLRRAADHLRARNDELAQLETLDTGKPIRESTVVDVVSAADALEYMGAMAAGLAGEHVDLGAGFAYTRREPLGVCAGIGAWNYPLQIAAWKAAPALACGNTMVFKPSELTPVTAVALAQALIEAGAPPGVFNVVHGDEEVGRALVRHPQVRKVSLTGEVATGKAVMADAAAGLKPVTMELGGKSPLVVFADADLENAVAGALMANFYTQGEVCSNGTRVFVAAERVDAFLDRLVDRVQKLVVGDPLDPATHVGALVSKAHLERVLGYVEDGRRAGARLVVGGRRVGDLPGHFMTPAVFADCTDDMRIVREEIFGPVMTVLAFSAEEEAIARANATDYGLAAGLFTRDLARAHRVAAALEAGTVWVNDYNQTPVEVPFGGIKHSGIGRENGKAALEHWSQLKTVHVALGDVDCPYPA